MPRRRAAVFESELPGYDYEHIFCDNDSKDGTPRILRELAAEDPHVKVILNSRNFGPFRSMFNGILSTSGDAVLCFLPADLQDPPEMIPQMVHRWESGCEVVYGVRAQREESFVMRGIRRVYYRLVTRLADIEIPMNVGEFQLVDRCVVDALQQLRRLLPLRPRHDRQLRLPEHQRWNTPGSARARGFSKNRLYHLIDQGLNGLVSFTNVPLRLCMFFGLAVACLTLLYGVTALVVNLDLLSPDGGRRAFPR